MARLQLGHMGYIVKAFNKPLEALKHFESASRDFDLVITDMAMPRMTGEQLAGNLREIHQDIPIILCTGYSDRVVTGDMARLGVLSTDSEIDGKMIKNGQEHRGKVDGAPSRSLARP